MPVCPCSTCAAAVRCMLNLNAHAHLRCAMRMRWAVFARLLAQRAASLRGAVLGRSAAGFCFGSRRARRPGCRGLPALDVGCCRRCARSRVNAAACCCQYRRPAFVGEPRNKQTRERGKKTKQTPGPTSHLRFASGMQQAMAKPSGVFVSERGSVIIRSTNPRKPPRTNRSAMR